MDLTGNGHRETGRFSRIIVSTDLRDDHSHVSMCVHFAGKKPLVMQCHLL